VSVEEKHFSVKVFLGKKMNLWRLLEQSADCLAPFPQYTARSARAT
jgi:hypothetical protein